EYFFHRSSVEGGAFEQLTRGSQVEFEIEPSTRGPRAGRVRPA
ncbi:MAG: cold-shock protein, partial [Candidatus Dormibacteria bacterium]